MGWPTEKINVVDVGKSQYFYLNSTYDHFNVMFDNT
jgi:hypothetical protein